MSTVMGGCLGICLWYCSGEIGVSGIVDQAYVWALAGIDVIAG